jgi:hypothetical protein
MRRMVVAALSAMAGWLSWSRIEGEAYGLRRFSEKLGA